MNESKLKNVADKWEQLVCLGWKMKSRSDGMAKFSASIERMSHRQMDILTVLSCLDINTISEMADFLKISKSTLSIIMNKLVNKELVTKEYPGSDDGRRVYFKISPKGNEILTKMDEQYIEGLSFVYSKFADEGKKLFREGIACLRKASNSQKTLFDIMTNKEDNNDKYSDEIKQIAKDMAFFFIYCKLNQPDGESEINLEITPNQFHLLMCILSGMDTLTKLEKHLGSSGSTLSIGISKMVEKGYVSKNHPDIGQDGRKVFIRVTEKGMETIKKASDIMHTHFTNYLSTLDDESFQIFEYGCDCILKALADIEL